MCERSSIAIVGASGAVGREALSILAERGFPRERVAAFASDRSAGAVASYNESEMPIERFDVDRAGRFGIVLLCVDNAFSLEHAPSLVERGATVIDNSSAFRMDPGAPLVIPEINGDLLERPHPPRLVANPNCSTILLLLALDPLRCAFGVERISVSTYQAVSGAGQAAVGELLEQTRAVLDGRPPKPKFFDEPCAFNVFPHESPLDPETGLNGEEIKMIAESRRIWNDPELRIAPTCARAPVVRSHSQAIEVTLKRPASRDEVVGALRRGPGLCLLEPPEPAPTSLLASGRDSVLVGRVRRSPDEAGMRGEARRFLIWISGDQLRKGAALNAVQIAERLRPDLGLTPGAARE